MECYISISIKQVIVTYNKVNESKNIMLSEGNNIQKSTYCINLSITKFENGQSKHMVIEVRIMITVAGNNDSECIKGASGVLEMVYFLIRVEVI